MSTLIKIFSIPIEFNQNFIFNILNEFIVKKRRGYICTINANLLSEAYINVSYKKILQNSIINVCDGSLLTKSIGVLHKTKLESLPGPDFMIKTILEKEYINFFLGSEENTLNNLRKNLVKLKPSISSSIFQELPFFNAEDFDYKEIAKRINLERPEIIWVSLGAPKQERFASLLVPHINQGIIICVGAAFDFYSMQNSKGRAPLFVRKMNLEWVWRLFQNPKKTFNRLRREIIILPRILWEERRLLNNKDK